MRIGRAPCEGPIGSPVGGRTIAAADRRHATHRRTQLRPLTAAADSLMSDVSARALDLFDDYIEMPPAQRERALAELSTRDPELYRALQALLDSDANADSSLLDRSPAALVEQRRARESRDQADAGPDPRLGTRLGPWRIERLIARGGMGSVYEAQRDDGQYRQRVALKCILAELATPALIAAFRDERNVLARLDHPGIAALIDAGVDDTGHPWFAMRYVEGIAIDTWCDRHRASVRQRVDLLIQACEALGYAHAQGVLHRDIKPSNLLVDADGRVQLVDFGIASTFVAFAGADREQLALSREYAAPEARDHGATAPATDLYALGVLSYRLLCGQWPTPLHALRDLMDDAGPGEALPMDRLLDDAAPAVAEQRGVANLTALKRLLAGDLSALVRKAVALRPQDRYASINEYAEDLQRWREHRPLAIRGDDLLYRARKFARRHRLAVGVAAAVAIAGAVGAGLALRQHRIAVRETQATAAVSRLFASTLGMATLSGLGSAPFSSKALLDKTERELRGLPLDEHPLLHARSLATLARSYAVLGDYRHAQRLADQAQVALGDARDDEGSIAATRLAMLNSRGRYAEAEKLARAQLERIGDSDDAHAQSMRLSFGAELAKAQWGQADTLGAVRTMDELVDQAQRLSRDHEEIRAELLLVRANFLHRMLRFEDAEADAIKAEALARPRNPILADDALDLLVTILGRRGKPDVLKRAQELAANRRRNLGPSHPKTAEAVLGLAWAQYPHQVQEDIEGALTQLEASHGRDSPTFAMALGGISWAIARDDKDNVRLLREALSTLQRTAGPQAEQTIALKGNLGAALISLSGVQRTPRDVAEGIELLRQTIEEKRRSGIAAPYERSLLVSTILADGDISRLAEAQRQVDESLREAERYYGGPHDLLLQDLSQLGDQLLYVRGEREQADRRFAQRIEDNRAFLDRKLLERTSEDYLRAHFLNRALVFRALHAHETCRRIDAAAHLDRALRFDERVLDRDDPITLTVRGYRDSLRDQGLMLDTTNALWLSKSETEAVNRRARACNKG
ncbi:serine/threonine-protein kinase [Lysobacter sp. Root983]|uniref:serine/threonine-protein kinase n=1 Tax=Lysobacter sp. Root983 TaxID=1736613 RepID=UPI0012FA63AA|nr:serine/threonine-protein kinase [Lysobacter sp. Root983]